MSAEPASGEAMEHLWTAAHEFLQAMRKLVDAADEFVEEQRNRAPDGAHEPRVQHIDIDVDAS